MIEAKERIQGIVFDLDDTLYPYREYVLSGFRAVSTWLAFRSEIAVECSFSFLVERFNSGERHTNLNTLVDNFQLDRKLVPKLISIYRNHQPSIQLFPDVVEFMRNLPSNIKRGMVTNGHSITQRNKLKVLGLEGVFFPLIISEEMGPDFQKPSEKPYSYLIESWRVEPSEIIVVGDDPERDLVIPSKLGMHTALVLRKGLHDVQIGGADQDFVELIAEGLTELIPFLSHNIDYNHEGSDTLKKGTTVLMNGANRDGN